MPNSFGMSPYSPLVTSLPQGQEGIARHQLLTILHEALAMIEDENFTFGC